MTFTADLAAADLALTSARCAALVDSRIAIPVLANALLIVADGRLCVGATNMDQGLEIAVPAAGAGETTVNAARLAAAAAQLDGAKPVTLKRDGHHLIVRQGRASWRLPTISADDFPRVMLEPVEGGGWDVEATALVARIEEVKGAAVVNDASKFYLEGVFFDLDADDPALVALDGYRIARVLIDDLAPPRRPGFILPLGAVRPLVELGKLSRRITVTIGEGVVSFAATSENRTERIRTRLIDGRYPDYRRAIPGPGEHRAALDARQLARAVARTAVVEGDVIEVGRGKKRLNSVRLDLSESETVITARNAMGEEAVDACESVRLAGVDVSATFKTGFLRWAVDSFAGADTLELAINDQSAAQSGTRMLTITRAADAEARRSLRVIMTMRG